MQSNLHSSRSDITISQIGPRLHFIASKISKNKDPDRTHHHMFTDTAVHYEHSTTNTAVKHVSLGLRRHMSHS